MIIVKKIFSIFVLYLFAINLFTPSVYSAKTCEVSDFTQMGQELGILYPAKTFWNNTLGWQADEFNEMSAQTLLNTQNRSMLTTPGMYSIYQIAGLIGRDPQEVADEIGEKNLNAMITESQIRELAQKKPTGFMAEFLGTNQKVPSKEEYMSIRMPNGQTVRLKEIYDRMGYDDLRNSCTLDQSYINGKVSYIALLNKDIRVGYTRSIETLETGQHLTATKTAFAINLNDGSSHVLPHTYEKIATSIGMINSAELVIGMATIAYSVHKAKTHEVDLTKAKQLKENALADKRAFVGGYGSQHVDALQSAQDAFETGKILGKKANQIDDLVAKGKIDLDKLPTDDIGFEKLFKDLKIDDDTLAQPMETYLKRLKQVKDTQGSQALAMFKGVDSSTSDLNKLNEMTTALKGWSEAGSFMVAKSFVLGLEWMGPARMGLQLSKSIVLLSPKQEGNLKDSYIDVNVNRRVGEVFDQVTDFLGMGKLMDLIGKTTGAYLPPKAKVKNVFVMNTIEGGDVTTIGYEPSITSVSKQRLLFDWRGDSEVAFFEDFGSSESTTMSFELKNINIDANLERKSEFNEYYDAIALFAPLLLYAIRPAGMVTGPVRGITYMMVNDIYLDSLLNIDNAAEDEKCTDEQTNEFIASYAALTGAEIALNFALPYLRVWGVTATGKAATLVKSMSPVLGVIDYLNPLSLAQMYVSSQAFKYANNCKDNQYRIIAAQQIPAPSMTMSMSKTIAEAAKTLTDQLKETSIGEIVQGMGTNIADYETKEILNARAIFTDQAGAIFPQQLIYLHLSRANMGWWGVFEKQCFDQVKNGKDKAFIENSTGLYVLDKKTGETKMIADRLRVLMEQMNQELGRTIIPNKIVSAKMNEPGKLVLQVQGSPARLYGKSSSLFSCISSSLESITGRKMTGDDLSSLLGTVNAIYTTKGRASFANGMISFIRFDSEKVESGILNLSSKTLEAGTEIQIPGVNMSGSGKVEIYGDGKTFLKGPIDKNTNEYYTGELLTIITERGKIEYNKQDGTLYIALYALASVSGDAIKSVFMKPSTAYDAECKVDVPVPYFDKFVAQVGAEENVDQLSKAMANIQKDSRGKQGGMNVLETEDYIYWFTAQPPLCQLELKIFNKKTGTWESHAITGPITMEQDKLVVPTSNGNFKFGLSSQNGVPVLSVTNPSGLEQLLPLLLARGTNGIFSFDPFTKLWYAMNGQDIPWNSDYISKGMAFQGTADGLRGIAQNSLISQPYATGGASVAGANALLAMPWMPEGWQMLLIITLLIGGLIIVREKHEKESTNS